MMGNELSRADTFRKLVDQNRPLQVVGAVNACAAMLAEQAGVRCLYVSGAGVANASFGLPDLGMTSLSQVVDDVRRISSATTLPLLVDCDTGWETTASIQSTVSQMIAADAAAIHLEDQREPKRCGHRPGKRLVSTEQMVARIRAAAEAMDGAELAIMARTDAATDEGLASAIQRSLRYVDAGAEFIFAEALAHEDEFAEFAAAVPVPVMANMTEFGRSPLLTVDQLHRCGIRMVLYPLTAFRAMNAAAARTYATIVGQGSQASILGELQTRDELYELLDYHAWEQRLDRQLDSSSSTETGESS